MTKRQELMAAKRALRQEYLAKVAEIDKQIEAEATERKAAQQAKKDAAEAKRKAREEAKVAKELERTKKLEERTAWMQAKLSRKGLTLAKWREEQIEAGRAH